MMKNKRELNHKPTTSIDKDTAESVSFGRMKFLSLFPSIIGVQEFADHAKLQDDLMSIIEQDTLPESHATTVNHGWQTTRELLTLDQPAIRNLRQFFDHSIRTYVTEWRKHIGAPTIKLKTFYNGWATILHQGGYQHEHVHSRNDLIGIYCVTCPTQTEQPSGSVLSAGNLTLTDPRPGNRSTIGFWNTSTQHSLPPVPGRLYLIPGFLPHRVDEVEAKGKRVTINFDIQIGA